MPASTAKHYHLIGIAGTAMGSLAGLLRAKGHRVTGSDAAVYPPMSTQLEQLGIEYATAFLPDNLEPAPDMVVVGNAISRGNVELEAVLERRLPYTSAANVIKEEFLRGRHVVAVAGTHGKTTTTTLVAWLLESGGLNPSFLIGGIAENFGASFRLTDSEYFVIEADEYDTAYFDKGPKMWHYLPWTAIVTNVEFDHADIYRDDIAYRFAFERFVNLVPRTGTLVLGWDTPAARDLAARSHAPVESYDIEPPASGVRLPASEEAGPQDSTQRESADSDAGRRTPDAESRAPRWLARRVAFSESGTTFDVAHDDVVLGEITMPLTGAFNVRNALAAIAAAHAVGVPWSAIVEGMRTFRSVRRRMEVRGTVRGVTVIDDFAHHPTAVRETIQAARQRFAGRRVVAIFEPRSYTAQRREMQEPYRAALAGADRVVLAGLFHPERYDENTGMNPDQLTASLRADGVSADFIPDVDPIVRTVVAEAQEGDVLLVMSNGGFGGIHQKLLDALASSPAPPSLAN